MDKLKRALVVIFIFSVLLFAVLKIDMKHNSEEEENIVAELNEISNKIEEAKRQFKDLGVDLNDSIAIFNERRESLLLSSSFNGKETLPQAVEPIKFQ